MATRDFIANQIRTAKLIMTGSTSKGGIAHKNLELAVYSESVAPNETGGNPTPSHYTDVGEEVSIFVSGTVNYDNRDAREKLSLFNGNIGTSGSIHFMNPAPPVAALSKFTVTLGNAAHGMTAGQKITLTSGDGPSVDPVTKTYVLVDPTLSDADTTASTHAPLVANAVLGANATVTGVKSVVDNALSVTTTANNNEIVFNVPTTANGESGTVSIRILDTLIGAQANVIQVKRTGGAVAPIHLIKAINGDSDAGNIVYGTGRGTAGIKGITASAGSHGSGQQIKLTLDRPGDHVVAITNTAGSIVNSPNADYFASASGAVTAGTAGDIAVMLTGDQATVLNAIRAAVLSSNGHNGQIAAAAALTPAASAQSIIFAQGQRGSTGNTVVEEDIANLTATNFVGGRGVPEEQDVYVYADDNRPKNLYLKGALYASGSRDQDPYGTISGSIHHTRDGLAYLKAGSGILISSGSNGQVEIAATGGGGGGNTFTTFSLSPSFTPVGSWGTSNNQVADGVNDTLTLTSGPNITIEGDSDANSDAIKISASNTQLSQEQVEDFVGGMVTGNTETGITVSYVDNGASAGKLDLVVSDTNIIADSGGPIAVTPGESLAIKGLTNLSTEVVATSTTLTTVNVKSEQLVQTNVFSPEGSLSFFQPASNAGVNSKMTLADLHPVGADNEVGSGLRLTATNSSGIQGVIMRTQVPKGATKVKLTACFQPRGSATSRDIELLVVGRKWEQEVGATTISSAKENTAGKNRWADEGDQHGTAQASHFQSPAGGRWRGFTSATKASNKITVNEGDNLYIVESRDFSLSDKTLRNSVSSAITEGDVLDIGLGRNRADGQNTVGTSVDTGSNDEHVVIYWVKVDFLA